MTPKDTEKNKIEGGTLYLVATPIGNLSDFSERAKKTLAEVDFVAAEDTRNTARLFAAFGISRPMVSYHEHNRRERGPQIVERLQNGESCALVTDAGMPAISDPGEDLVALCAANGVTVTAVPGCSAGITALALSGLSTARFAFEGFLPRDKKERRARLQRLATEERTMIFHEAPHRLTDTLSEFAAAFGGARQIALCRELTKRNEEILRTDLDGAILHYQVNEPRGEYVLILAGGTAAPAAEASEVCDLSPAEHVAQLEAEGLSRMDAIKAAAKARGMAKNELYRILHVEK